MLNNIPKGLSSITRNMVMRHPNTFNCLFYRRKVERIAPIAGERQTIGGMMVLSIDDETEISWGGLGSGYALKADQFQPSLMMDRMDANNGFDNEFRFLIESELEVIEGGFIPSKNDVFFLFLGDPESEDTPKLAFEIVGVETSIDVPPYVPRYVCNRRDDLTSFLSLDDD